MEPSQEPGASSTSDLFFDALDVIPLLLDADDTLSSTNNSAAVATTTPSPESAGNVPEEEITFTAITPPPSLRRRKSSSKPAVSRGIAATDSAEPSCNSPSLEKRRRILCALKDQAASDRADASISTLTSSDPVTTTKDQDQDRESSSRSAAAVEPRTGEQPLPPPPQGLLVSIAGLLIKAIFFQINLLIKSFGFPIWLLYCSFLLVMDPFGVLKRVRDGLVGKVSWVLTFLLERVSSLFGGSEGAGKLAAGLALGCFWSLYVCLLLTGLLVTAFLAGGLVVRCVVEEPVRMMEDLNFDYTKVPPEALVPLASCDGVVGGWECSGKGGIEKCEGWRRVPLNHKLQLTISLTLPESDYNRNLGMFQVRAEFLSANGKVTSSSSQPCLLHFKSSHLRVMESFLKSGTLLAGYSSESQILRLKMTGFTERTEPTVCIRVTLEQRAEYRPGAGIPEIYAASLKLESELPLLKRIIWNWRRTVYVWISMGLFMWELFIVLLCCRPVVVPRGRQNVGPTNRA